MKLSEVMEIIERAKRFKERLSDKGGTGTSWSHISDDGETHKYIFNGVIAHERVSDDIASAYVWAWSAKDYIKAFSKNRDKTSGWVEGRVNADPSLCICAEIANTIKHGKLNRRSRSGQHPVLGQIKYEIPQESISSMAFRAFEVEFDICDPERVSLELPVIGVSGKYLGDAFSILDAALESWQRILDELNLDESGGFTTQRD